MHQIVKVLKFSYGHRLLDYEGKCARPHGHNARVEVELRSETLDPRGMVADFGDVKDRLSAYIEAEIDHRMVLRRDDPLVPALEALGEPVCVLEENPTAENLARLLFEKARSFGLPVAAVRFWETDSSCSEYREDAPSR